MTIEPALTLSDNQRQDIGYFGCHVIRLEKSTATDCDSSSMHEEPVWDQHNCADACNAIYLTHSANDIQTHKQVTSKADFEESVNSEYCDTVSQWEKFHRDQTMSEKSDKRKYMTLRSSPQNHPFNINGKTPDDSEMSILGDDDANSNDKKTPKLKISAKVGRPKLKDKLETKECDKSSNTEITTPSKGNRKLDEGECEIEAQSGSSKKRKIVREPKEEELTEGKSCPICCKIFDDSHSFTLHIREHNANSPNSQTCLICSRKLSSTSSLDRHMYVHSGERPFQCTICKIAFTTNGNMHRHMRIHTEKASGEAKLKGESKNSKKPLSNKQKSVPSRTSFEKSPDTSLDVKSSCQSDDSQISEEHQIMNCPVCGKSLNSSSALDSHMESHPNDPIKCEECGIISIDYQAYQQHACRDSKEIPLSHNQENSVVGFRDLSYMEFSSAKFSLIAKKVCENQSRRPSSALYAFECHTCGKAFPCKRTLCQHEMIHNAKTETSCHSCNCSFASPACLLAHQLKHRSPEHCKTVNSSVEQAVESQKEDFFAILELRNKKENWKKSEVSCSNEDNFESSTYFIHGRDEIDVREESQVETSNDFAEISAIISLASKTPFMPDMRASPVTAAPASPPKDSITLMPDSPVVEGSANACSEVPSMEDHCNTSFQSTECNEKSLTNLHDDSLSCNDRPISLQSTSSLKRQNRSHGQNNTSYSCDICSYKSSDKSTLMRHLRTHNGERPFQCKICRYAFTTKANSQRHVKKKHQISPEDIHSVIQYNPDMSDMKNPENLQSENGNSETVCKYCNKDFKFNRVLRHHLRSLNNSCSQKPFACAECKLGFSTKNNCIRHISNQHPEKKDRFKELVVVNMSMTSDTSDQECQQNSNGSPVKESKRDGGSPVLLLPSNANLDTDDSHLSSEPLNLNIMNKDQDSSNGFPGTFEDDSENSHAEKVSIAQSLVSLSEALVPQEMPLDLSVSALDLTLKCDSQINSLSCDIGHSSAVSFERLPLSPILPRDPFSTTSLKLNIPIDTPVIKNIFVRNNVSPLNLTSITGTTEPVDLVRRITSQTTHNEFLHDENNSPSKIVPHISASGPPNAFIHDISSNNILKNEDAVFKQSFQSDNLSPRKSEEICTKKFKLVKEKLTDNQKQYTCNYCSSKFTLKSNKERHIKRKHPQYARPTRSRNFIPTLSPTNIQKQPVPTLSNKTRDALRTVLSSKANTNVTQRQDDKASSANSSILDIIIPNGCSEKLCVKDICVKVEIPQFSGTESKSEKDVESEGDNIDLASVSDVIDTANSPVFKRYLTGDDFEINPKKARPAYKFDDSTTSKEINTENTVDNFAFFSNSRRKSSYTKSPNTVACTYCNRKFPWKSSLRRHLLTHTGQKPYKCSKCPIHFTTKSNMDRHLERKHPTIAKKSRKHFFYRHKTKTTSNKSVDSETKNTKSENEDVIPESSEMLEAESDLEKADNPCEEGDENNLTDDSSDKDVYQDHTLIIDQDVILHQDMEGNITNNEFIKKSENENAVSNFSVLSIASSSNDQSSDSNLEVSGVNSDKKDVCSPQDINYGNVCCFCLEKFKFNNAVRKHIREQHFNSFPCCCKICKVQFSDNEEMLDHVKIHLLDQVLGNDVNNSEVHSKKCSIPNKVSENSFLPMLAIEQSNHASIFQEPTEKKGCDNSTFASLPNGKQEQQLLQDNQQESDLIENLLGINDPTIVDKMLDTVAANRLKHSNA